MKNTLILGVGNYLLSDDGLSVHVLARLQETNQLPDNIQIVDGGTCGLDLLQYLEGVKNLIIIDAINRKNTAPGTIIRLSGD
ncbi:MAG TPA: hydrogenase maturation protease, partial [Anaerolineaceae bacterium]|nr:hydrogenase maturation protease [Anaerolineaceae bacterium]